MVSILNPPDCSNKVAKLVTHIFVITFASLLLLPSGTGGEISCPPHQEIPYCSCFVLDDQLHVQCSGSDIASLKKSLQVLNGPVKSYSVYDLDAGIAILPNGVTDNVTSPCYHIQISHSSLEELGDTSLRGVSKSLESLAIVSSKLKSIPQSTLSSLRRLKVVDFEGNQIQELGPYSFHNILLQKLNLKGNLLENVSEHAFWGLEETLMDVDMSENKLRSFPFSALRRLRLLSSLNLAWNELTDLKSLLGIMLSAQSSNSRAKKSGAFDLIRRSLKTGTLLSPSQQQQQPPEGEEEHVQPLDTEWPLLKYLNLNSNYLRKLDGGTFTSMKNLRTLSIHLNSIDSIDPSTFSPLVDLETIDLSHNKLSRLPSSTFQGNAHLISIDLSNNHLHSVSNGLLQNLSELKELFLNGNNILQLTSPTFVNTHKISVLYLQGNSLRFIESGAFTPLKNLSEIRLSDNFIRVLPQDLFLSNEFLSSVSLDGNLLEKVAPSSFDPCWRNLRELRLQNNEIRSIPSGFLDRLETLEEINLENNDLGGIRGLSGLRRIRHVSLSRNAFDALTPDLLPGSELTSFSLGFNGIKSIQDGAFTNQSTLSILYLGNNKIARLRQRAFSGLRSLERLYLQHNNISWIHSDCFGSQIKALQYLDLSFNVLKTINRAIFSGLAFIEEINLSHNQISTLEEGSFSNLRSLRILDLSSNKLASLHYSSTFHLRGLEILKICCNALTEFYVPLTPPSPSNGESYRFHLRSSSSNDHNNNNNNNNLVALKELDLNENKLSGSVIRWLFLERLEVLQVSGNNLTDLDENTFDGFPFLNFLSAERSHIWSLPPSVFKSNPNLAVIRLSDNFITVIPDSLLAASKSLRELHLRQNKLPTFPYAALQNASFLEVLTLSGNVINVLDLSRIHLPRLKQLDMHGNKLNKISGTLGLARSMPILQVIDLGQNSISHLKEDFMQNVSLTQANLGGNSFQKVPFALSESFVTTSFVLNMSGNPLVNFYTENHHHPAHNFSVMDLYLCETNVSFLTSEEFKAYPRLHRLVIKRNPLITLLPPAAFSSLQSLNLLDLSENTIQDLKHDSFFGLLVLKSLNLSHNAIKNAEPFHPHLGGLQDLDLSFNQLSRLTGETFANLVSLVTLRLRGNLLSSLEADVFAPLARISVLDLSQNYIENVPTPVLRQLETGVSTLKLEENPLNCDCSSKELWEWLQAHPKIFTHHHRHSGNNAFLSLSGEKSNFVCQEPKEYRGKVILDLELDSVCSSPPAILKLVIQDLQTSSAVVSWQGRNNSGMQGYMIGYHALNHDDQVRWIRTLPAISNEYRLPDLESDTPYLICVLGLTGTDPHKEESRDNNENDFSPEALMLLSAESVLRDSPMSKCTKIRTYSPTNSQFESLLQHRLGIVVGAGMGGLAFLILMTTAICVKVKKRRHVGESGGGNHALSNGRRCENEKLNPSSIVNDLQLSPNEDDILTTSPALNGSHLTLPHDCDIHEYHHHHHHEYLCQQPPYYPSTLSRFGEEGVMCNNTKIGRAVSPPRVQSYS